jgi:hypothetical protein
MSENRPNQTSRVSDYRPAIDRVLKHYGLPPEALELVSSVKDWREENDMIDETDMNSSRTAIFINKWEKTGAFHIVMCETVSWQKFEGIKYVIGREGFADEVKMLTSESLSLLHLMLHEIAGHVLNTSDQAPRDFWAFKEMEKHKSYFQPDEI